MCMIHAGRGLHDLRRLLSENPPCVHLVVHPMLWSDARCTRYGLLDSLFDEFDEENSMIINGNLWKRCLSVRDVPLDRGD